MVHLATDRVDDCAPDNSALPGVPLLIIGEVVMTGTWKTMLRPTTN